MKAALVCAMLFVVGCIQRHGPADSVPLDHPANPRATSSSLPSPTTVFSDVPSATPSASMPQDGSMHEHHH